MACGCSACGMIGYHLIHCPYYNSPYYNRSVILYPTYSDDTTKPTGWLCPRCKKVNAPDVKQCDCEPGVEPSPFNLYHDDTMANDVGGTVIYKCFYREKIS